MFDTFKVTRAGGRAINMDAVRHAELGGMGCWVLADGLGGHANSEVAARVAVDSVVSSFMERPTIGADAIRVLIERANQAVLDAKNGQAQLRGIATTLVILLSDGQNAIWAHVGDSRLYHIRDGRVFFQTRDHSLSEVKGVSDSNLDGRARESGALLKALGTKATVLPRISELTALARDDAFLLCVDGFWEKLAPTEIEIDYAKSRNTTEWLRYMERRVASQQTPDSDNYTAIAVRVENPMLSPIASIAKVNVKPSLSEPAEAKVAAHEGTVMRRSVQFALAGMALVLSHGLTWYAASSARPAPTYQEAKALPSGGQASAASALSQEDRCVLAWGKIRDSRDLSAYARFIESADTAKCGQIEDAKAYAAEVKAWKELKTSDIKQVGKHLRLHMEGPSPHYALQQLFTLLDSDSASQAVTPPATVASSVRVGPDAAKRAEAKTQESTASASVPDPCATAKNEWKKVRNAPLDKVLSYIEKWNKTCSQDVLEPNRVAKSLLQSAHDVLEPVANLLSQTNPVASARAKALIARAGQRADSGAFQDASRLYGEATSAIEAGDPAISVRLPPESASSIRSNQLTAPTAASGASKPDSAKAQKKTEARK